MTEKLKYVRAEVSKDDHASYRVMAAKLGISMFQLTNDLVNMIARREMDTTIILNDSSFSQFLVKINGMLTNGAIITEREGIETLIAMLIDGEIKKSDFIKKAHELKERE